MNHPAARTQFDHSLALAERRTEALSAALLAGLPEQVALAAHALQQSAQDLLAASQVRPVLDSAQQRRLQRVAQGLAMQREACVRRGAVVDRTLDSIIPSIRPSTYQGAHGPYGQQARRSGAFKLFSA